MMWWDGEHMGAGGWVAFAFMIVFWILVLIGIFMLIRYLIGRAGAETRRETSPYHEQPGLRPPRGNASDALRILEERYARGEIDREEFLQRKSDLLSS